MPCANTRSEVTETGGPKTLGVGAIADRQLVRRGIPGTDSLVGITNNEVRSVSGGTSIGPTDDMKVVEVDASGGATTVTILAVAAPLEGFTFTVKKSDSSGNAVTLDANGGETIDGATTYVLAAQYDAVTLVCESGRWVVVASHKASGGGGPSAGSLTDVSGTTVDVDLSEAPGLAALPDRELDLVVLIDASVGGGVGSEATRPLRDVAVGVIFRDGAGVTVVNTTTETSALNGGAGVSIPANLMGTAHKIRFSAEIDYINNSGGAATLTLRIKFGATTLWGSVTGSLASSAVRRAVDLSFVLVNLGATNSQGLGGHVGMSDAAGGSVAGFGSMTSAPNVVPRPIGGVSAEDTTSAKTLDVTAQHSVANVAIDIRVRGVTLELV